MTKIKKKKYTYQTWKRIVNLFNLSNQFNFQSNIEKKIFQLKAHTRDTEKRSCVLNFRHTHTRANVYSWVSHITLSGLDPDFEFGPYDRHMRSLACHCKLTYIYSALDLWRFFSLFVAARALCCFLFCFLYGGWREDWKSSESEHEFINCIEEFLS